MTSSLGRTRSFVIPASWGIGHNIVDPAGLGSHAAALEEAYLELYEGWAAVPG